MFIYNISSGNYSNITNDINTTNNDITKLGILSIICASILVCFCVFTRDNIKLECI